MKLLLIREQTFIYGRSSTSFGLGIIGTIAKEIAKVRILDNNSQYKHYSIKDFLNYIEDFKPDVIGFNVNTFNILSSTKLVTEVRKFFPSICLIAGGLHTYSEPQEVLDIGVHIVAKEDAEQTIIPLLEALHDNLGLETVFKISEPLVSKLNTIPGLLFKIPEDSFSVDTGPPLYLKDLDTLPFVDYDLFNLKDYIMGPNDTHYVSNVIVSQRGCPFNCPFCQSKSRNGLSLFRENSAQYKVEYMKFLHEKYNLNHILFHDSNFTVDKQNVINFCNILSQTDFHENLNFYCQTNVAIQLDEQLLEALKNAGCVEIALGVERLSPKSLKLIRKNKKYEVIKSNINMIHKIGINITSNCLIGFPFDTVETVREEMRLFKEASEKISLFSVAILIPIPGTEIYDHTNSKKWYLNENIMSWKPPYYHLAFNYSNNAWAMNYFNLDEKTLSAIREMQEYFFCISIKKMKSRLISSLFIINKILAYFSLFLYQRSRRIEDIIFSIPKFLFLSLWKLLVNKYHVNR